MTVTVRSVLACFGVLAAVAPVCAADSFPTDFEEPEPPVVNPYGYAWSDPRMLSGIGVGVMLGGGVTGFTDAPMRDLVSDAVGGAWNVRVSAGTHIPLGVEVGYVGSASTLHTFTDVYSGVLIGTTFEAAVRYTILPLADGTPYLVAGAGWQHFAVHDERAALADTGMRTSGHVVEFPIGVGVAYRDRTGWVGDVRGTFRATTDSPLLTQPNGEHGELHSWEASAAFGYEF